MPAPHSWDCGCQGLTVTHQLLDVHQTIHEGLTAFMQKSQV